MLINFWTGVNKRCQRTTNENEVAELKGDVGYFPVCHAPCGLAMWFAKCSFLILSIRKIWVHVSNNLYNCLYGQYWRTMSPCTNQPIFSNFKSGKYSQEKATCWSREFVSATALIGQNTAISTKNIVRYNSSGRSGTAAGCMLFEW